MDKIKIAFIDDNESLLDSFQARYDGDKYEIHTFKSLDIALLAIEKSFFSFHFVILDGKGHLKFSETGHGDEQFALVAREKINSLISLHKRDLPFCYFTAYSEEKVMQIIPNLPQNEEIRVFNKTLANQESLMFDYIQERYERLEETSIRKQFTEIFEIFDLGFLDSNAEQELILLISLSRNLTDENSKQFSRSVRPFLECIVNKLESTDRKFAVPKNKEGKEQGLSGKIWYLSGSHLHHRPTTPQLIPTHLYEMVSAIQKSSSTSSMHHYDTQISGFTAHSYLYVLLDFMLWFKNILKNKTT